MAGAELSALAIQQLFEELEVVPSISELGDLKRYSAPDLDIYVGDIFALSRQMLGPVDAVFKAMRKIVPHDDAQLTLYEVHAVTEGTDAQATVSVVLAEDGRTVRGTGAHVDTMVASAKAYANALGKLIVKRGRSELPAVANAGN